MSKLKKEYEKLQGLKSSLSEQEASLQQAVMQLIDSHNEGIRGWARKIGVSAQYACDIRNGRRKISQNVMAKILEAK